MDKFNCLKNLLTLLGTEYTEITPTEIIVECPCDIVYDYDKIDLPQRQIINDPDTTGGSDEICIHIEYDEKNDSLNWLVVDCH